MKPDSQNARVLAVLSDGLPHSCAEIHRRAGFSRLNSRVAELRSKLGLQIVCEHVGGTGPEAFEYTLLTIGEDSPQPGTSAPRSRAGDDGSPSRFGPRTPDLRGPGSSPVSPVTVAPQLAAVAGEQLSLEVAA